MSDTLPPAILATLRRLAGLNFEILPMADLSAYYVIARGPFVAMVERREDGSFGRSGNPGKLGKRGFALFVRKGEGAIFAAKGHEEIATPEEVEAVRVFAAELKEALTG